MNFKLLQKNQSKTFLTWMSYYIIILLLPMLIGTFVYIQAVKTVNDEVGRMNDASLKQVKTLIDGKLEEIYKTSASITINEKVKSLIDAKEPIEARNYYTMHEIRKDFNKFMISNSFIKGIYIYYNGMNCILSDNGTIEKDEIKKTVENNFSMDYKAWKEKISKYNSKEYSLIKKDDGSGKSTNKVIYFQTLSMPNGSEPPTATLMILIDVDDLEHVLKELQWASQAKIMVVSSSNVSMGLDGAGNIAGFLNFNDLKKNTGRYNKKIEKKDMIITHTYSDVTNWEYVGILPSQVFLNKVRYIKTIIWLYVLACLILGSGLAYYLAKRSYNPLKNLLQMVIRNIEKPSEEEANEFGFLEHSLKKLLYEKEDFRNSLKKQDEAMRNSFLSGMLKGRVRNLSDIENNCRAYNVDFLSDVFQVMIFQIEDLEKKVFDEKADESEELMNLITFIIRNVVEELTREKHVGYVTEVDGMMACIINLINAEEGKCSGETMKTEIVEIAEKAKRFIEEKFEITLSVTISNTHSGITGIPKAYSEAVEIVEYKTLVGETNMVIHYDDFNQKNKSSLDIADISDKERQFMTLMTEGDYKNASYILNDIFKIYIPKNLPSLQIAKCRVFGLINSMMNAFGEVRSAVDISFFDELEPVQRLLRTKTIVELQNEVNYIFKRISEYYDSKSEDNTECKIGKIVEFIHNNYYDPDLGAPVICEKFDMSSSYLSRIFKKHMGVGLLHYIHQVRLNKAKVLMDTELSIKEIAEKVGYYNSLALIRTFKKYEGVTPGKYREVNGGELWENTEES